MTLRNISQAFGHCIERHESCRVWREMRSDGWQDRSDAPAADRRQILVVS
ncbi:MAG: hypothetical protein LLG01_16180 [Planctomycetaceae bacterium]|nr:hypothetical protein [Planctomycetaceae bacterium]